MEEKQGILKLIQERKRKESKRKKELSKEERKVNLKKWTTFYRRNINIYISRRLGINLHPFQHVMLYLMSVSKIFFAICSRGLAKTFTVSIYAIAKCMLYPYSEVVITATTIEQARRMVKDKMVDEIFAGKMSPNYPFLKYLYDKGYISVTDSEKEIKVEFTFNKSWIKVLPANENSRGSRATLLIYEECRLIKKGIIDSVFSKMAHPRQAVFKNLPQYTSDDRWLEECQSVYITSARFTTEWFWRYFKMVVTQSFNNSKIIYNFFAGDIFLSLLFGLKTEGDYLEAKNGSNELEHRIEDLNEMVGEAEDAFFKRELFKKNQIVKLAFKPPTIEEILNGDCLKNRKKIETEYRMLWIDYAFADTTGSEENDNSVIGCLSILYDENKGKFRRIFDYITTHSASDSVGMETKIREMFWDYQCDYIVLDLRNGGELAYNNLTKPWYNPNRGEDWIPNGFTVCRENELHVVSSAKLDDLVGRTVDVDAIPCIIPIIGTAELNSIMWMDLKKRLRDEECEFLLEDIEYESMLESRKDYFELTSEEKRDLRLPYSQTMFMIHEAINLSQEWKDGRVKLTEPRSGTKDRIVAMSYGNYIATLIENKINKNNQKKDDEEEGWEFLSGNYDSVEIGNIFC